MKYEKELKWDLSSYTKVSEVPKKLVLGLMLFKYILRDLAQKCQCDNKFCWRYRIGKHFKYRVSSVQALQAKPQGIISVC